MQVSEYILHLLAVECSCLKNQITVYEMVEDWDQKGHFLIIKYFVSDDVIDGMVHTKRFYKLRFDA